MKQIFLAFLALAFLAGMGGMIVISSGGVAPVGQVAPGQVLVTVTPTKVYAIVLQAQANEQAALETAVAQETRQALDAIAKGTSDALAIEQQATRQSLDVEQTRVAIDAQATQAAGNTLATATASAAMATTEARAVAATATAQSVQVTRQAVAATTAAQVAQATATMQSAVDNVETTRQAAQGVILEATAQSVTRQTDIDESRQTLTTWGGWLVLFATLAGAVGLAIYLAPVIKARLQVVRRKHDETEPLVVTLERVTMPLRAMFPVIDHDDPLLPSPQMQDRTTARAQLANVVSAARGSGHRRRAAHRPATRPASQAGRGVIEVIEPEQVRGWIDDARGQLIEGV